MTENKKDDGEPRFLVRTRSGGNKSVAYHVPADDATRDDPRPACSLAGRKKTGWISKETAQIPESFRDMCDRCDRLLDDDSDEGDP